MLEGLYNCTPLAQQPHFTQHLCQRGAILLPLSHFSNIFPYCTIFPFWAHCDKSRRKDERGMSQATATSLYLCKEWNEVSSTVQNLKKNYLFSLSVLCSSRLILTKDHQISGQNKSEAREPEGLVKIIYGFVASSLFKRAGNSNEENFLNCGFGRDLQRLTSRQWCEGENVQPFSHYCLRLLENQFQF